MVVFPRNNPKQSDYIILHKVDEMTIELRDHSYSDGEIGTELIRQGLALLDQYSKNNNESS